MKVLVRLGGDLVIKSDRVRSRFLSQLKRNMLAGFRAAGVEAKIDIRWTRVLVRFDDGHQDRALEVLGRTFGISSYSVIEHECASDLQTIVEDGERLYADKVRDKSFAVRARRAGARGFRSKDIAWDLGGALGKHARKVDLTRPEVQVHVEARDETTFFYGDPVRGAKGLPLGTGGRALCLISGGFDSAVAAWMMMKRGVALDFLFCNLAGKAYERSVVNVVKRLTDLWGHGGSPRIHVVDFEGVARALREEVKPAYAQVVLKRLFYRAADLVADLGGERGAVAVVTGEAIGQVSSQTLTNLAAIDKVARRPVIRPLICWDKEDIIALAREIGTYELSAGIQEYCQLVPDKPITAARVEAVDDWEDRLPKDLLERTLETRRTMRISDMTQAELTIPYLSTEEIPATAVVVDCRPREEFERWHLEGATHFEFHDLLESFSRFDRSQTYVICCPVGLQSAVAAEKMQGMGFEAYSLKGGVEGLRRRMELR